MSITAYSSAYRYIYIDMYNTHTYHIATYIIKNVYLQHKVDLGFI